MTTQERFWAKVDRSGDCWLWTAARNGKGYGQFRDDRRQVRSHRFSWELANGPIPDGLHVLHDCPGGDNPSCVNPAHLFLGTAKENSRDMKEKGRYAHGERMGSSRLTSEIVMAIRRDYVPYVFGYVRLAKKYGIPRHHAQLIVKGLRWSHLPLL